LPPPVAPVAGARCRPALDAREFVERALAHP
jgi:hypothetical protein